ncbi:PH domain-containing protein [Sediminibacterium sp.]|uniref:PH domain-containing protein n=1 Tax=Sediminibacterium sp. TaxID=1917865 RepID=UPI0026829BED|nr:hypothetical protein [Chitinophaga sp.]
MNQFLAQISIVVDDYDRAIEYYTKQLHFDLIEDTKLSESKRWVKVKPKGLGTCSLLLAKAATDEQQSRIGNQTGGRVFLFLHTDDFKRDYQNLLNHQITIIREPSREIYGTVAVFKDLYGNLWDLIEPVSQINQAISSAQIPKYSEVDLAPVETSYKKVLYISWSFFFGLVISILLPIFYWIESLQKSWIVLSVIGTILLCIVVLIAFIEIGFKNLAWALRDKDIIFKKGWLFQSTYIIPFVKVQHCELLSGPIGRKFGLASIKLNTAASNDIDISINGLKQDTAEQLKAFIINKIETDEHQQI